MAVDAFLKFEGLEGEASKVKHDFDRLGDGFTDLGGAFLKLVDDVSSTDIDFFKANVAAHIKHDVFAVDQSFFKVGEDFVKLSDPLHKFDDAIVKFTDQFVNLTPSDSETPFPLAADFLKYETDLKVTGLDFLGAASDIKGSPTGSLALTFNQISIDYKNQSDDALKISGDLDEFVKISGISDSSKVSSKVGETFLKITLETVIISSMDQKLSTDFQKISTDFAAATDGGLSTFDQVVLKYSDDFVKLSQDLKLADGAFTALGGDTVKLADAIEHSGPVTIPTITKG